MKQYALKHEKLAENTEIYDFEKIRECIYPKLMTQKSYKAVCSGKSPAARKQTGDRTETRREAQGSAVPDIPHKNFGEFKIIYLVDWSKLFPHAHWFDYVTEKHLSTWQIGLQKLHMTAMENLSKNNLHIRYVVKNHVPWDEALNSTMPDVTVYQISCDDETALSYALDIVLLTKQLKNIERIMERPFYIMLCEPYPLMIMDDRLGYRIDFDRIYEAVRNSSYAPDRLFSRDVYKFEHGALAKSAFRITV